MTKFNPTLTPPKTKIAGGYASNGIIEPGKVADLVFRKVIGGPWLVSYMLRRFGWPNIGSDDHKDLCAWCLTTPIEGLCLVVRPYMGEAGGDLPKRSGIYGSHNGLHFAIRYTKEVGAELDRDPEVERLWAWTEKVLRRWWDREGSRLYFFGTGDPEEDDLVHDGGKDANGKTVGMWSRPRPRRGRPSLDGPPVLKKQGWPSTKGDGLFLWWLAEFVRSKHADVLPEKGRKGKRQPTAFQQRAMKAIDVVMQDLLRPVYVRDVGFSPLGHAREDGKGPGSAPHFEGAGCTPEYLYSARRKRHERKVAEGKALTEQWNASHPVGTPVRYRPVRGQAKTDATKTRSEAWTLGNGEPVVAVEGQTGGVSLKHLKVITKRKART